MIPLTDHVSNLRPVLDSHFGVYMKQATVKCGKDIYIAVRWTTYTQRSNLWLLHLQCGLASADRFY